MHVFGLLILDDRRGERMEAGQAMVPLEIQKIYPPNPMQRDRSDARVEYR